MRSFALTPARLILLILLFVLTAVVAMLAYLPANWVWSQLRDEVQLPPGLEVQAIGGTLWSGSGLLEIKLRGMPERTAKLSWQFGVPSLSDGVSLNLRLETRQSWLQGSLTALGLESVRVKVERGMISLDEFSDIARQNGLMLPGSITIDGLELIITESQLIDAQGTARWEGGLVGWQMGSQRGQAQFPPLLADVQDKAGGLVVAIVTAAGGEPLIKLMMTPAGLATMTVRRRLLAISGMQGGGSGEPDDTVFRVQTQVLQ